MQLIPTIGAVVLVSLQFANAGAQTLPPVVSRPELNLATAKQILLAGERYAAEKGWPAAIAVVDDGGWTLASERMDGAPVTAGVELAYGKARTSALFKRASADLENAVNKGRTAAVTAGFLMMQGGQPIKIDGHTIGAVGVSADTPAHDDEIAAAALRSVTR